MKRKMTIVLLVLLVVLIGYGSVWVDSYYRARDYYIVAMNNYNSGNKIAALKGEKVLNSDGNGYVYLGGFQQSLEVFESPFAIPKPALIDKADTMCTRIISELDLEDSKSVFKKYFGINNRYLPEILIRMGEIYEEEGMTAKAKETYEMLRDAFGQNDSIRQLAEDKLELLE